MTVIAVPAAAPPISRRRVIPVPCIALPLLPLPKANGKARSLAPAARRFRRSRSQGLISDASALY
jgi:hypothetical protein